MSIAGSERSAVSHNRSVVSDLTKTR